jgi:hypothetical protein
MIAIELFIISVTVMAYVLPGFPHSPHANTLSPRRNLK